MNTIQLSWATLLSRALSHWTLPSRHLKRPKSAILKCGAVSFLFTLSLSLRIQNSTVTWSLQQRLSLTFISSTSPSLVVTMRSRNEPLLLGSSVTWRRKLLSMHTRNLLDCLCPAVLSFCAGQLKSPMRTRACNCKIFLSSTWFWLVGYSTQPL